MSWLEVGWMFCLAPQFGLGVASCGRLYSNHQVKKKFRFAADSIAVFARFSPTFRQPPKRNSCSASLPADAFDRDVRVVRQRKTGPRRRQDANNLKKSENWRAEGDESERRAVECCRGPNNLERAGFRLV